LPSDLAGVQVGRETVRSHAVTLLTDANAISTASRKRLPRGRHAESNDANLAEEALSQDVERVLASEHTLLLAAQRLCAVTVQPIRAISEAVHAAQGLGRDLVVRCIAVRNQETFESSCYCSSRSGECCARAARVLLRPLPDDRFFLGCLLSLDQNAADEYVRVRTMVDVADGYEAQRQFLPSACASLNVDPVPPNARGMSINGMEAIKSQAIQELRP
jgi:hypothetical protein